ncbi:MULTISPECIES: GNAT family N-acetyltransferase [Cysteiniphilum]|uniref:GNAT family N-acetyltransferase n=1 Tax=Cysteiniphilum TaxID=2056696 RepID=UPI00177DFEBE|nr:MULTISPECIES: GNAT family N-acetyltransferase [Cysteiniphilum]
MTIQALTKAHQSQVQQLFADVNFFNAEWFFSPRQLFFGFFTKSNELAGVAHIEIYHNAMIVKALTTHKAHRNQKIAAKLLAHIEALTDKFNCDVLYAFTQFGANYLECSGFEQTVQTKLPLQIRDYMSNHNLSDTIIMKKALPNVKKHLMRQESLTAQVQLSHLVA